VASDVNNPRVCVTKPWALHLWLTDRPPQFAYLGCYRYETEAEARAECERRSNAFKRSLRYEVTRADIQIDEGS
jgi:hypothetical protein